MDTKDRTDDQLLSAYIDGQLPDDEAAVLVTRLANEPELVRRLEAMRRGDDAVRAVYGKLDQVPLPEGITRLFDGEDEKEADSRVVAFRRRGMPRFVNFPVAIAASVALLAGFIAWRLVSVGPGVDAVGALVAGNLEPGSVVQEFLETAASGEPRPLGKSAEMRIILSFESEAGDYCRQLYVAATDQTVHGVACRDAAGWHLEAVALGAPAAPGGQYGTAATDTPEAVASAVDSLIGARDPLSKDEELRLISKGWKKSSE